MNYSIDWDTPKVKVSALVGKTCERVTLSDNKDRIEFVCTDGSIYVMCHPQDCCEHVRVEDVTGDIQDLVGSPILKAEESTSDKEPEGYVHEYEPDSQTWTFYKFATIKGWVDIRWFGESNGYYSESVDFVEVAKARQL